MPPLTQVVLALSHLTPATTNATTIPFTDSPVAPTPADHYERYLTFLAVGTRTYTCDPTNATSAYGLAWFDYDLYDAEADPERAHSLGKHSLLLHPNSGGGQSLFYTANNTLTYWVGKGMMILPDPSATSPLDLALEQTLRSEASEPKPEAGKYDLGVAVYATRFGAVGGNLPSGTKCTGKRIVNSETYYSMFKQVR